jgi:Na+-transporting NADH:ubiquinone oxidoreductase subunit F
MSDWILLLSASAIVFTGLILVFVAGLNAASQKLAPSGPVTIDVNDGQKVLCVPAGASLLMSLATEKVFLPSACGGQGTCGMCKCQVLEGGGELLPTEVGYITRAMAREGWRLACQVKVKRDLRIRVPPDVLEIRKFQGTVRSNRNVASFIKELIVDLPPGQTINFRAGGYIQIDIPPYEEISFRDFDIDLEYRDMWDRYKLWDLRARNPEPIFRAYSMANHPGENTFIMLNVRIATPPPNMPEAPPGRASSWIFHLKPGDVVTMSGPYGEFFAKDTDREMVYIGGGAGMAPMRSHIFDLLLNKRSQRRISFWYGARSRREMFYDEEFRRLAAEFPNFRYTVALSEPLPEDHWDGPVGFIHQVVYDMYLKDHPDPTEVEYYLCGPPLMIAAVNRMLYDLGVEKDMIAYDEFG